MITRRTLFRLLAGAATLPVISRLPPIEEEALLSLEEVRSVSSLYRELTSVTRKAFVPRLLVQLYFGSPLTAEFYSGLDPEYPA